MTETQPEPHPFQMEIVCEDVRSPQARMVLLAGTAEALCRATNDDAAAGVFGLIWAAIHIARVQGGFPPEKLVAMVADATAMILEIETDEPTEDTGPGLH